MRWFDQHLEDGVTVENVSDRITGFQIAGPRRARSSADAPREDVSDMRFLDVRADHRPQPRPSCSGSAIPAIWATRSMSTRWSSARSGPCFGRPGRRIGLKPFGMRAMMSLRLDRFFGSWMREFSPDYTAAETGLDRFVAGRRTPISSAARRRRPRAPGPRPAALQFHRRGRRRRCGGL
jgi:dimethylglycine dehydrogenase